MIAHVTEQLSLCTTASRSLQAATTGLNAVTTDACISKAHALQQRSHKMKIWALVMKYSPRVAATRKSPHAGARTQAAKNSLKQKQKNLLRKTRLRFLV